MRKSKILLFLVVANFTFAESSWYNQKLEGWYYFSDEVTESLAPEEAYDILEEEKQKTQEALSLAVLSPTQENVKNYVSLSNKLTDRSASFAKAWGDLLEEKPSNLANTHFLLFCFKGKDPAAPKAAQIALQFVEKNGWTLKAVSLDGFGTEGIVAFEKNAGIVENLHIETTPSFYAIEPSKNRVIPLKGKSLDELENSLRKQP